MKNAEAKNFLAKLLFTLMRARGLMLILKLFTNVCSTFLFNKIKHIFSLYHLRIINLTIRLKKSKITEVYIQDPPKVMFVLFYECNILT